MPIIEVQGLTKTYRVFQKTPGLLGSLRGLFNRDKLPSGAPATDSEVERVVINGKGFMPAFAGRFTQDQMSALLAYLHTGQAH